MSDHRVHHNESHGNHPMSILGFVLMLAGFTSAAVWLLAMAGGHTGAAVLGGLLMVFAFTGTVAIFMTLSRRHHHSPVVPDNTPTEVRRYLDEYRR